ncbi:MAG: hypothetical protein GXP45_02895 [bacterium]|nr:hypothetical protein [bacterium]
MSLSQDTQKLQNFIHQHHHTWESDFLKIKNIYQKLVDCITDHNHLYYIKSQPIISDQEYDELFSYLKKIEEYYPQLISSNSPTQGLV